MSELEYGKIIFEKRDIYENMSVKRGKYRYSGLR